MKVELNDELKKKPLDYPFLVISKTPEKNVYYVYGETENSAYKSVRLFDGFLCELTPFLYEIYEGTVELSNG